MGPRDGVTRRGHAMGSRAGVAWWGRVADSRGGVAWRGLSVGRVVTWNIIGAAAALALVVRRVPFGAAC